MGVFQTYDGPFEQADNERLSTHLWYWQMLRQKKKIAWGKSSLVELQGGGEKSGREKKKDSQNILPVPVCEVESDNCNTFVLRVQLQK